MTEHDALRSDEVDLSRDELREAALDGLAVDVASSGGGEDRDVGTQVVQDTRPVTRRVLVEEGPVRRFEQVDERAAVAARALIARDEMLERRRAETREMGD